MQHCTICQKKFRSFEPEEIQFSGWKTLPIDRSGEISNKKNKKKRNCDLKILKVVAYY